MNFLGITLIRIIFYLFIFAPFIVLAKTEIEIDDIFVTATRSVIAKENIAADVTTINAEEILQAGMSTLPELLQRQPGIEISNNGGPGKVSTIGIRGTSSTHTIILIDGVRMNAATSGFTALEHIPLSQIEKIEIVRGAASSIYGQDAIGGVIQIFTKKGAEGFNPYLSIGYGRYQTSNIATGVRGGDQDTTYAINFSSSNTKGFSAFFPNSRSDADEYNLDKDGYQNQSVSSSIKYKLSNDYEVDFNYLLSEGKNKFDNSYGNYYPTIDFRNETKNQILSLNLNGQITKEWGSSIKVARGVDQYTDKQLYDWTDWTYIQTDNLYKTTQNQITWNNSINLPIGNLILLYDRLEQKIKTTEVYQKTQRTNDALMIGYNISEGNNHIQTSLRQDWNSNYEDSMTGNIGYAYNLTSNWIFAASLGTAFVSPSFNYAYASADPDALGNPDLKPEKSRNTEISVRYNDSSGSLSLTAFQNQIKDFIIYEYGMTPQSTENLNEASITGLTISGDRFFNHFQIKGNLTTQTPKNDDTDKYLPYRATLIGGINLNYYMNNWIFGVENTGTKSRFADKANTRKVDGYILTNLFIDYRFSEALKINLRMNNALNKDYATNIEGNPETTGFRYQTAGRNIFANLNYDF